MATKRSGPLAVLCAICLACMLWSMEATFPSPIGAARQFLALEIASRRSQNSIKGSKWPMADVQGDQMAARSVISAVRKYYCLEIALSVRCAAAVVAVFMISPPRRVLDDFVTPDVGFIGGDNASRQLLAKRLRFGPLRVRRRRS
ncbi:hypothetical protein H4582DRAFT_2056393 [Lactarius indigo]|nr:hypothetical protein H4582DRAFT_2056393 [Lactarius indigo]